MSNKPQKPVVTPPQKKVGAQTPVDPMKNSRIAPPQTAPMSSKQYRVLKTSFINGQIVQPGEIVQLPHGVTAGKALELLGAPDVVQEKPEPVAHAQVPESVIPVPTEKEIAAGKREVSAAAAAAASAGHKSADADPI